MAFKTITTALWRNNPIAVQILGICSALAVTIKLETAIAMGVSLIIVVSLSNFIISCIRNIIPHNIRIIVQMAIIATLVIIIEELLTAYFFTVARQMSIFVGLIITNCIVLGRAEGYAMHNPPLLSLTDGFANALGYALVLAGVGFMRELLGQGALLGFQIIPLSFYAAGYQNMGIMAFAPGAFIAIGLFVWLGNALRR